jgi:hypothetical protein
MLLSVFSLGSIPDRFDGADPIRLVRMVNKTVS